MVYNTLEYRTMDKVKKKNTEILRNYIRLTELHTSNIALL
jgi:hypothetical protein